VAPLDVLAGDEVLLLPDVAALAIAAPPPARAPVTANVVSNGRIL
jgi:hypothetical protein